MISRPGDECLKRVVLDCDNTAGIPGRDIDDALALLYLNLYPEAEIVAVTTSFGNGSQDEVWEATNRLVECLAIDVPIYRGCNSPDDGSSEASEYLAAVLGEGVCDILITGAASNVGNASETLRSANDGVEDRVQSVTMMGGILEPLKIGGFEIEELNLSCDPGGVVSILEAGIDFAFVTGNLCTDVYVDRSREEKITAVLKRNGLDLLASDVAAWSEHQEKTRGDYGFCPWDLVAAVYYTNPEIFLTALAAVDLDTLPIGNGMIPTIENAPPGSRVAIVRIPSRVDEDRFWDIVESTLASGR